MAEEQVLKLNPLIYSLPVIYSASYVFLDKAYIKLDGDPEKEIKVMIKAKTGHDSSKISDDFCNELINYANYNERAKQSGRIREALLQRAVLGSLGSVNNGIPEDIDETSIPWKQKYARD
jgi:His-Xaa-Ser system protein HxsD